MPEPLAYRAYRFLWHSLDWVYPPDCVGCGRSGELWCDECNDKVTLVGSLLCPVCGIPQTKVQVCSNCQESMPSYKALRSWAIFKGELRKAIHRLKYRRNMALGQLLAVPIINQLHELDWPIEMIIPVPLGLARLAERGYNQASLLAKPIALYLRLPFQTDVIKRSKETQSQVGLSFASRKENVAGAFTADQSKIVGKSILVIDDVITSGATMNACAIALCEAGASEVYGFSLARAGLLDPPGTRDV
jgi:competence protein ComFC